VLKRIAGGAVIAVWALSAAAAVQAEDSSRRLDSISWMRTAVGARAQALGGAFTARADDGTASYWNPAFIESFGPYETQFTLTALPLTLERQGAYLSYIQKLSRNFGSIAFGWNHARIGAIEVRDASGVKLKEEEDLQNTFAASYGLALSPAWKIGATFKYYLHQLPDAEGKGIGLDAAAAYRPGGAGLRWEFGAALKELSPGLYWTTGRREIVAPTLRLGAAYHIIYDELIAAAEVDATYGQKMVPHLGLEWWAWDTLAIRTGLDSVGVYFGAGYRFGQYQFDYSYSALLEGLSDEHRITLMYKL